MDDYNFRIGQNYISFSRSVSNLEGGQVREPQQKITKTAEATLRNNKAHVDFKQRRLRIIKKISKMENQPKYLLTLLFMQECSLQERLKITTKLKRWLGEKYQSNYFILKLELNRHDKFHIHILTDCNDIDGLSKKWYKLNKCNNSILFDCLNEFEPLYIVRKDKIGKDLKLLELLEGKRIFTVINNKNITYQEVKERELEQSQKDKVVSILAAHATRTGTMTPKYRRMLEAGYGLALQLPEEVMGKIRLILD